jgi:cell division protein YceG involved in septum cleavage
VARVRLLVVTGVAVGLRAGLAPSGPSTATGAAGQETTLRIIFPEGFSARQMVDRVAAVRRIAIAKRGVTPRLTGTAYRRAVSRAVAPAEFRRYLKRRSLEGFLFPAL